MIARIGELPETPLEAVQQPAAGLRAAAAPSRAPSAPRAPARGRHPARAPRRLPRRRRGREGRAPRATSRTRRRRSRRASAGSTAMREAARKHVAELARYAVEETGSGASRTSSRRTLLCVDKTPGPEILRPIAFSGDDGLTLDRARPLRRHRLDHADDQPDRDHHQQRHRHGRGRQRGGVQRPPVRGAHVCAGSSTCSTRRSSARAARRTCSPASSGRRSRARRR